MTTTHKRKRRKKRISYHHLLAEYKKWLEARAAYYEHHPTKIDMNTFYTDTGIKREHIISFKVEKKFEKELNTLIENRTANPARSRNAPRAIADEIEHILAGSLLRKIMTSLLEYITYAQEINMKRSCDLTDKKLDFVLHEYTNTYTHKGELLKRKLKQEQIEPCRELLKKILKREVHAYYTYTKAGEAITLFIDNYKELKYKHEDIAYRYQNQLEKILAPQPTAEERCLTAVTNNPGITKHEVSQILYIPENSAKTLLWKLERKRNLIKAMKADEMGTKAYWRIQKDEAQSEETERKAILHAQNYAKKSVVRVGRPKKQIDRQKVYQLKKEGKSSRQIGKELNISHSKVAEICRKI